MRLIEIESEKKILLSLLENREIGSPAELSRVCGWSKPTVNKFISKYEKCGIVTRKGGNISLNKNKIKIKTHSMEILKKYLTYPLLGFIFCLASFSVFKELGSMVILGSIITVVPVFGKVVYDITRMTQDDDIDVYVYIKERNAPRGAIGFTEKKTFNPDAKI